MHHYHLMTDQELVCHFQSGEEQAFAELLNRHKDTVFSAIFYLVKDKELAEDLFQDTFIRIISKLQENLYKDEGKFRGWACRIAHNIVIDYFRKDNRMKMVREDEEYSPFDYMFSENRNPEQQIIYDEKIMMVRGLIESLPEHQREIVILRHYGGLSFKEIADMLHINLNTALGRMHSAVVELREKLKGKEAVLEAGKKRSRKPKMPKPENSKKRAKRKNNEEEC